MQPLVRELAVVEVRNVDDREDWRLQYGERIPVVEVDGRMVCQYRLDVGALKQALVAAAC
jgi:hypothetical protein